MKSYNYLGLCLLFVLTCCVPPDKEYNLGGGYYLLGKEYNTTISKIHNNNPAFYDDIILGEISGYGFNKDFIIVFRNASIKAKGYFNLQDSLWREQKGKDSLQYWIIEKSDDNVIGPLNKKEYVLKRKQLEVPNDLQMKFLVSDKTDKSKKVK